MYRILIAICLLLSTASAERKWMEVTTPYFRIISDGPEGQTKQAALAFEQMRAVIRNLTGLRTERGGDFVVFAAQDENTMETLLPKVWEKKGDKRPAGVFFGSNDRDYAVIRLDLPGDYPVHVVYHEYVHKILSLNYRHLPVWANEGLAEFYSNAHLDGDKATVGRPSDEVVFLNKSVLLPLRTLLTADQLSPDYRKEDKARIFYAQSWALTHYLMLGPEQENRKKFLQFLQDVQSEKDEVALFEKSFGPLDDVQRRLQAYIHRLTPWPNFVLQNAAKLSNDKIAVRTLSGWEEKAELGRFYDASTLREKGRELLTASVMEKDNATAEEGLGLSFLYEGQLDHALPYFKTSLDIDPKRYLAAYYYASNAERLSTKERRALFEKVAEQQPQFDRALFALAKICAENDEDLSSARLYALRAISADPSQAAYFTMTALIYEKMGDRNNAVRVAEKVVREWDGPETYTATRILARLKKNSGDTAATETQ